MERADFYYCHGCELVYLARDVLSDDECPTCVATLEAVPEALSGLDVVDYLA